MVDITFTTDHKWRENIISSYKYIKIMGHRSYIENEKIIKKARANAKKKRIPIIEEIDVLIYLTTPTRSFDSRQLMIWHSEHGKKCNHV